MATPVRILSAAVAICVASGAQAEQDRWSFDFGQGVSEYAVGSFATGDSNLALSCAEAGIRPGSVSISLTRAGFTPARPTPATFITDSGKITVPLDIRGGASFASLSDAPKFRALWRLIATGKTLRIDYGPGEPFRLPLAGAAELLTGTVCPKQLAR